MKNYKSKKELIQIKKGFNCNQRLENVSKTTNHKKLKPISRYVRKIIKNKN